MTEEQKQRIEAEIAEKKERRQNYLAREKTMLTGGAQSYGIGSRSLTRYTTELSQIRAAIKELDAEIKELEAKLDNQPSRKRVGLVFRDSW